MMKRVCGEDPGSTEEELRDALRALGGPVTNHPQPAHAAFLSLLAHPEGATTLRPLSRAGVLRALFPFVAAWEGFDQGGYHAYDLLEHSLRAAEEAETLANRPETAGLPRPDALRAHLAQQLEPGLPRAALLKWAALLHDVAKPVTAATDGARLRFTGHDVAGGRALRAWLKSRQVGRRAGNAAQALVAAHLRLFSLAHQHPPTKTARLRYLRDLGNAAPEALLLSLADERATGPEPPALEAVTATARELLTLYWEQRENVRPPPLLRGTDLLRLPGVREGPVVGELLRQVAQAAGRGDVTTPEAALCFVQRLLAEGKGG